MIKAVEGSNAQFGLRLPEGDAQSRVDEYIEGVEKVVKQLQDRAETAKGIAETMKQNVLDLKAQLVETIEWLRKARLEIERLNDQSESL